MNKKEQVCGHNWIVVYGSRAKQEIIVKCNLCNKIHNVKDPTPSELQKSEGAKSRNYVWNRDQYNRIIDPNKPKTKRIWKKKAKKAEEKAIENKVENKTKPKEEKEAK